MKIIVAVESCVKPSFELFHVAIPLSEPCPPAWIPGYPQTVNRFTLLWVGTGDGVQVLAGISNGSGRGWAAWGTPIWDMACACAELDVA